VELRRDVDRAGIALGESRLEIIESRVEDEKLGDLSSGCGVRDVRASVQPTRVPLSSTRVILLLVLPLALSPALRTTG